MVTLWHKDFGFLVMFTAANNQWTNDKGVRYGSFHCDYMGTSVNLPIDEVMITHV